MARSRTSQLVVELLDRVSGPAKRVAASLGGMNRKIKEGDRGGAVTMQERVHAAIVRNDAALAKARMGIVDTVGAYYALKAAIGGPVQAAREFESAMADVRKVVDFPTPEALKAFKGDLVALSKEIPVSLTGLAAIAAAAGQAGIAGEDLVRFTGAAAKVGTAFDISADEAGESMAKIMTGMGMTIDETVLLADAMNHLSNSQASSAAEILDVMKRVGATSKQYGFAAEETAAFASAMIAAGAESEVAATSFRNMGRALTKGDSATKRQSLAFKKLGLDATNVAKRMQEDAVGTTVEVIEKLASLPKEVQASVSSDLFGDEARALGPLLTNLDLLRGSLGLVENRSKYAGSAFKEFEVRSKTFDAKVLRFQNTMRALSVTIGDALLPVLSDLIDRIAPVIEKLTAFVDAHPDLVANVMMSVGALVALKGAISALRFVGLLGKGGALSLLAAAMRATGTASIAMGDDIAKGAAKGAGAVKALDATIAARTAAMNAAMSGIKWRALTAGALGFLAMNKVPKDAAELAEFQKKNREQLENAFRSTPGLGKLMEVQESLQKWWHGPEKGTSATGSAQIDALRTEAEGLRATIADIQTDLGRLGEGDLADQMGGMLRDALAERQADLADVELALAEAEAAAGGLGTALGALGGAEIKPVVDTSSIDQALEKATRLSRTLRAPGGAASTPSSGGSGFAGARAKGGPVSAGKTYLVGEQGPEPFTPSRSGYVHPTGRGGGGVTISEITISPVIHAAAGQEGAIVDQIIQEIEDRLRRSLNGIMADYYGDM